MFKKSHNNDKKTAVICMVYNGYEYISEFILHHLNLCDHIYMIDHNSEHDLRALKMEGVTCVRSRHEAQFQSECTNLVIEHFKIKENYDWLFVLDIDEFLPFKNKEHFQDFLQEYKNHPVIQFQWRNGVPFYDAERPAPKSLIDCNSIRFFHKDSPNCKTAVNIKKTKGKFFVPTGAHNIAIDYSSTIKPSFLRRKKCYIASSNETPLLHIVAFNKEAFVKKIKTYVEQMKYRRHVKGQGGWVVEGYPEDLSHDEWLWYIANFRVQDEKLFYECKKEYFIENDVFSHLDKDSVYTLREAIANCPPIEKRPALNEEKLYLNYKNDDRDIAENIKWFAIDQHHEIISQTPDRHRNKAIK